MAEFKVHKIGAIVPNPFRNVVLQREFESAAYAFSIKHRNLFNLEGGQHIGSSFASYFWAGYNGVTTGRFRWDAWGKTTLGYAYYRAGQACRKLNDTKEK